MEKYITTSKCWAGWQIDCFIQDDHNRETFIKTNKKHFETCHDCGLKLLSNLVKYHGLQLSQQGCMQKVSSLEHINWDYIHKHQILKNRIKHDNPAASLHYKKISPTLLAFLICYVIEQFEIHNKENRPNTLQIFLKNMTLSQIMKKLRDNFYFDVIAKSVLKTTNFHFHFQSNKKRKGLNNVPSNMISIITSYYYSEMTDSLFKPILTAYYEKNTTPAIIAENKICTLFFPK